MHQLPSAKRQDGAAVRPEAADVHLRLAAQRALVLQLALRRRKRLAQSA
jgi:hypothetical protein